jgi:hypothetical protein
MEVGLVSCTKSKREQAAKPAELALLKSSETDTKNTIGVTAVEQ